MIERMYLTKAKDWSYEREWRIVDWAAARTGSRGFHPLAPDVLVGVILGCRITDHDKRKIWTALVGVRHDLSFTRRSRARFPLLWIFQRQSKGLMPFREGAVH